MDRASPPPRAPSIRPRPSPREAIDARALRELGRPWSSLARRGWERYGDLVVLQFLPRVKLARRQAIAAVVGEELDARCVIEDRSGVRGRLRRPQVRVLWGEGTRTVHTEHGLKFAFDAARVMFSSGNTVERARMGSLDCRGETVVDLFAGIGYFSIPLAARAKAKRVFACELNPDAFEFLEENAKLNRVEDVIVPLLGDCRKVAPMGVADRVVCGYIGGTERFLATAVAALKPQGGVIHFHEAYPQETKFEDARRALGRAACGDFKMAVLAQREVKSFAPGIDHVVVDAEYRPLARRPPQAKHS